MTNSLGAGVRRGLAWSLIGNCILRVGTFAMSLILARLLAPAEFGTYAVGLTYLQIAIIVNDVGVTSALVQWRGDLREVIPTARTITYATTVLVTGAMVLGSDGLANFSENAAARSVILVLAVSVFLDGLMSVSTALLWREFQQGRFMGASLSGFAAQLFVAVGSALAGLGALSFALGMAADAVVRFILISGFARAGFKPAFNTQVARKLVLFGIPLSSGLAIQAVLLNVDYLIISRSLDASQLGLYTLAFNVSGWIPGILGAALGSVTLAGFARLAEEGSERLSAAARRSFALLGKVLLPAVGVLAVGAHEIIRIAYGERWLASAIPLAWLSFQILPRMFAQTATQLLVAQGRTRLPVIANLIWLAALVPGLSAGASFFGIAGAAAAQALVGTLVALPVLLIAVRRGGISLSGLVGSLSRPTGGAIAASAAGAGCMWLLGTSQSTLGAVGALTCSSLLVLALYYWLGLTAKDRADLGSLLRRTTQPERGGA